MYRQLCVPQSCDVSDPRDTFYAIFGLACNLNDEPSLLTDYNKTLEQIQTEFYAFFKEGFGYEILSWSRQKPGTWRGSHPSWLGFSKPNNHHLRSAPLALREISADALRSRKAVSLNYDMEVTTLGYVVDRVCRGTKATWDGQPNGGFFEELPDIMMERFSPNEEHRRHTWRDLTPYNALNPNDETCRRLALRVLGQLSLQRVGHRSGEL